MFTTEANWSQSLCNVNSSVLLWGLCVLWLAWISLDHGVTSWGAHLQQLMCIVSDLLSFFFEKNCLDYTSLHMCLVHFAQTFCGIAGRRPCGCWRVLRVCWVRKPDFPSGNVDFCFSKNTSISKTICVSRGTDFLAGAFRVAPAYWFRWRAAFNLSASWFRKRSQYLCDIDTLDKYNKYTSFPTQICGDVIPCHSFIPSVFVSSFQLFSTLFNSFQSFHRLRGNCETKKTYENRELRVTIKAIGCILVLLLSIKLN